MKGATKKSRLRKITIWLGLGLGLFLAALLIFLIGLALLPTGYAKFEQAHRESARQVDQWIRSGLAAPTAPASSTAAPPTKEPAASRLPRVPSGSPVPSPAGASTDFYKSLRELTKDVAPGLGAPPFTSLGVIRWDCVLLPPDRLKSGTLRAFVENDPEVRRQILDMAGKLSTGELPEMPPSLKAVYPSGRGLATTATLTEKDRLALHHSLDCAYRFLLEENWRFPDFSEMNTSELVVDSFYQAMALAMLRADLRGERAQAARLFSRALDVSRVKILSRFPLSGQLFRLNPPLYDYSSADANTLLLLAGLCKTLDDAELARAASLLERSVLTPEMFRKMLEAFALRTNVAFRQADKLPLRNNGWHRFMGGGPERLVNRALHPIAAACLERSTLDWTGHAGRAHERFNVLSYLLFPAAMNLEDIRLDNGIKNPFTPENYSGPGGATFNQDVQLMRLVLACVRWHRLHGHYPARIADLAPAYLDRPFTESPASGWMVLAAPAPSSGAPERPVFCYFDIHQVWEEDNTHPPRIFILVGTPAVPLVDGRIMDLLRK